MKPKGPLVMRRGTAWLTTQGSQAKLTGQKGRTGSVDLVCSCPREPPYPRGHWSQHGDEHWHRPQLICGCIGLNSIYHPVVAPSFAIWAIGPISLDFVSTVSRCSMRDLIV